MMKLMKLLSDNPAGSNWTRLFLTCRLSSAAVHYFKLNARNWPDVFRIFGILWESLKSFEILCVTFGTCWHLFGKGGWGGGRETLEDSMGFFQILWLFFDITTGIDEQREGEGEGGCKRVKGTGEVILKPVNHLHEDPAIRLTWLA